MLGIGSLAYESHPHFGIALEDERGKGFPGAVVKKCSLKCRADEGLSVQGESLGSASAWR